MCRFISVFISKFIQIKIIITQIIQSHIIYRQLYEYSKVETILLVKRVFATISSMEEFGVDA